MKLDGPADVMPEQVILMATKSRLGEERQGAGGNRAIGEAVPSSQPSLLTYAAQRHAKGCVACDNHILTWS